MPARSTFSAAKLQRMFDIAIFEGTLEAMMETQTEMQKMVSQPGRGRVYAKTAGGASRLDRFMGENVGLNKTAAAKVAVARWWHGETKSKRKFRLKDALDTATMARRKRTRSMVAMRQGFNLSESDIGALIASKKGARNLGDVGLHRASAPGDPPTVKKGGLRRAIQVARPRRKSAGSLKGWQMSIRLKYARWLEDGTTRMEARPYVKPTLEIVSKRAPDIIKGRIRLAGFTVE
jgi:hypothetical protein